MTLRAAAGVADITPAMPCELGGYEARKGAFRGVAEKLEINGVVLSDIKNKVVLMTADLLYVTEEMKEEVWHESGAYRVLGKDEFVFGASHTHFAPAVDKGKPRLGMVRDAYVGFVVREAANLLRQLLASKGGEVVLSYSEDYCPNTVNRRRKDWSFDRSIWPFLVRKVRMAPNAKAVTDNTVRALSLRTPDRQLLAVIWSYACHPTASPDKHVVSSEFPGACRRIVREREGASGAAVPVLFFQGFSGDVRPKAVVRESREVDLGVRAKLKALVNGGTFYDYTSGEYEEWVRALANVLISTLESVKAKRIAEPRLATMGVTLPLENIVAGATRGRSLTFRRIDLSSSFHIVAVSAEVAVAYLSVVREGMKGGSVMTVGCVDGTYGYLPTDTMIAEGGYEGNDFLRLFGYESWAPGSIETMAKEALGQLGTR